MMKGGHGQTQYIYTGEHLMSYNYCVCVSVCFEFEKDF